MKLIALTIAVLLSLTGVTFAQSSSIAGVWTAADGSSAAQIAPCVQDTARLCAIVVADTPEPGEASQVGQIAMSGIEPAGRDRWRGRYHNGEQTLPATLRLRGEDRVAMRVCVGLYCATEIYVRGVR